MGGRMRQRSLSRLAAKTNVNRLFRFLSRSFLCCTAAHLKTRNWRKFAGVSPRARPRRLRPVRRIAGADLEGKTAKPES
jgi:hypothetical protein